MTEAVQIGVDPGLDGAIVVLNAAGELVELADMPTQMTTTGRREINAACLADLAHPLSLKELAHVLARELWALSASDSVRAASWQCWPCWGIPCAWCSLPHGSDGRASLLVLTNRPASESPPDCCPPPPAT